MRQVGARAGILGPFFKKLAFFAIGVAGDGARLVHGRLADICQYDFERRIESLRAAEVDCLLKLGELGVDRLRDRRKPPLLVGIVERELAKIDEGCVDSGYSRFVRLEVILVAGEEITALSGFGVLELGHKIREIDPHLMAVSHPGVILDQKVGVAV